MLDRHTRVSNRRYIAQKNDKCSPEVIHLEKLLKLLRHIMRKYKLRARDLLNNIDTNRDGVIDAKELRRVVNFRRRTDLEFRTRSLEQLKNKLDLNNIPYRIEAYDISNLGPEYRVGSMVVMEDGLSKPSMYRKFHIKSFLSINSQI